jgi:hypothetical protein
MAVCDCAPPTDGEVTIDRDKIARTFANHKRRLIDQQLGVVASGYLPFPSPNFLDLHSFNSRNFAASASQSWKRSIKS